jgi:hypothetical protein
VAQPDTDAVNYRSEGCRRVSAHMRDCLIVFDMSDEFDDEDDSDIADEDGSIHVSPPSESASGAPTRAAAARVSWAT